MLRAKGPLEGEDRSSADIDFRGSFGLKVFLLAFSPQFPFCFLQSCASLKYLLRAHMFSLSIRSVGRCKGEVGNLLVS